MAESRLERIAEPAAPTENVDRLVGGNTAFAFDLYQAVRASTGNLVYSPYSVSLAFAMTYATGVALLGGTTQFVLKLLIDTTGSTLTPSWYIIGALAAGMLALTQLRPRYSDGQQHLQTHAR